MKGQAFIVAAREAMNNGFADPRDRLQVAAQMMWKAMFYEETWPDPLRRQAANLIVALLDQGPIAHTVDIMADSEVQSMLMDMDRFIADFEHTQGQE